MIITTTSLPRYEAWPAQYGHPAYVRYRYKNKAGLQCTQFPVHCDSSHRFRNVDAAICARALAAYYGGIADVSRVVMEGGEA